MTRVPSCCTYPWVRLRGHTDPDLQYCVRRRVQQQQQVRTHARTWARTWAWVRSFRECDIDGGCGQGRGQERGGAATVWCTCTAPNPTRTVCVRVRVCVRAWQWQWQWQLRWLFTRPASTAKTKRCARGRGIVWCAVLCTAALLHCCTCLRGSRSTCSPCSTGNSLGTQTASPPTTGRGPACPPAA